MADDPSPLRHDVTGAAAPVPPVAPAVRRGPGGATLVAIGILASRVAGLVRESLKARYLGATGTIAADAFTAAFRIPNMLQNLLGEGALSAAFIPVYARLVEEGRDDEARRLAGAIAASLALLSAVVVLAGMALAPALVGLIAPGFAAPGADPARLALTIQLTRILFPGAALFVLSAWCLGILNSHRRLLLPYAAPVAWNVAIIVALLIGQRGGALPAGIALYAAWGSVAGAALQFGIQLPAVLALLQRVPLTLGRGDLHVRQVFANFAPVAVSRGVVQVSAFVDLWIASALPRGMTALLGNAQTIWMLPVSLFGMAVSAAELPEMSRVSGDEAQRAAQLRLRLSQGLSRIAYFVVPSAVAIALLGDAMGRLLFESRRFTPTDTLYLWAILAAASLGLVATTFARLYSSGFFAMHDTRSPLRYALVRVGVTLGLGLVLARLVPAWLGIHPAWGAAGLGLSASVAGWVELALLRRGLHRRVGSVALPHMLMPTLLAAAAAAAAAGVGVQRVLSDGHPRLGSLAALVAFGAVYLLGTLLLRVPQATSLTRAVAARLGRPA
jgi:putative peptidoglycan lipid II flippase